MRLGPFEITRRTKAAVGVTDTSLFARGWSRILEPFSGAWQRNILGSTENVLAYAPVYACATLIASDIGKLRIKLTQQTSMGVWEETPETARSPFLRVLEKPNRWQTRIKFLEQWLISKVTTGNTYVLKERETSRGMVKALTVLDPHRCKPYVSPDGDVWYALGQDNLAQIDSARAVVPASEIIHDVMSALYHPLCGVSPITACAVSAVQGLRIQANSARFFGNHSMPGGILTAPGTIATETAKRLKDNWEKEFTGENVGKVAVLGDGLKYEQMAVTAVDAQLIEQLKWTAHDVCTAFHVPPYMIGVGPAPTYNNIEALNAQYYSQCLQNLIESIEVLLDEGLELTNQFGTELDIDSLLRMDTSTRMSVAKEAMTAGMAPNEVRKKFHGLGPVQGGNEPLMQEQNWPIRILASRTVEDLAPAPASEPGTEGDDNADLDNEQRLMLAWHLKSMELGLVTHG